MDCRTIAHALPLIVPFVVSPGSTTTFPPLVLSDAVAKWAQFVANYTTNKAFK